MSSSYSQPYGDSYTWLLTLEIGVVSTARNPQARAQGARLIYLKDKGRPYAVKS